MLLSGPLMPINNLSYHYVHKNPHKESRGAQKRPKSVRNISWTEQARLRLYQNICMWKSLGSLKIKEKEQFRLLICQNYSSSLFSTGDRTWTCTVAHQNLNLARLPIPPHLLVKKPLALVLRGDPSKMGGCLRASTSDFAKQDLKSH